MSRSRKDILDTEAMLQRLTELLADHRGEGPGAWCRADAESLRRISMTLHRWHELECGDSAGCIVRGRKTREVLAGGGVKRGFEYVEDGEGGTPHLANYDGERPTYHAIPDREAGARKRLGQIMQRYPSLTAYVQGDPRGCALYILKPGDVPEGADVSSCYSRGLAVYQ